MSFHWSPTHVCAIAAEEYVKMVDEATNGRLKITTYPGGQLYKIDQAVEAVSTGSVEMIGITVTSFVKYEPAFNLTRFYGLWDDMQQVRDFFSENAMAKDVMDNFSEKLNIKILAYDPSGPTMFWNNVRPLNTIEDLNGLKLRTLTTQEADQLGPMGVSTVRIPTGEVYTSLQQGMVEGSPCTVSAVKGYSWWDFLDYGTLPYLSFADGYMVANAEWFASLPADIQGIVVNQVGPEMTKWASEKIEQEAQDIIAEFEQMGKEVNTMEPAEWKRFIEFQKANGWQKLAEEEIGVEIYNAALEYTGKS
jgi:TRAP-type C4-dicarboxylate transport system substrate-binding protein